MGQKIQNSNSLLIELENLFQVKNIIVATNTTAIMCYTGHVLKKSQLFIFIFFLHITIESYIENQTIFILQRNPKFYKISINIV